MTTRSAHALQRFTTVKNNGFTSWLLGFLVATTAVVFDIWSIAGASVAVIFLLWLTLSLRSARRSALWTSAGIAVCISLIGFFTLHGDLPPRTIWAARGVSIVAIWLTTVLCFAEQQLRQQSAFWEECRNLAAFLQSTIDALATPIAILEEDGTIVAVNSPWHRFSCGNGLDERTCGVGTNYLTACGDAAGAAADDARRIADGIRSVAAGRQNEFYHEYPCRAFDERWYSVRVTGFRNDSGSRIIVTHDDVTGRKQAELKLRETNGLLEQQAATDGLTGLANRRTFDQTLEKEWKRCQRSQSPLSVAMLDVDHFKQYNDLQGHQEGDECLRAIAREIQANVRRPSDLAARYGGEEFAIILPETDPQGAATVMRNILAAVHRLAIRHPSPSAENGIVTVSIGGATMTPTLAEKASLLVYQADQALYEAKSNGRDQVVQAAPRRCEPAIATTAFSPGRALQPS